MLPDVRSAEYRSRRAEGMTLDACARTAAVTALALAALWGAAAARSSQSSALAQQAEPSVSFATWKPFRSRTADAEAQAEPSRTLPVQSIQPSPEIEKDFTRLAALDPQTLDAGSFRIRLEDIPAPPFGTQCRRLDGVMESCAVRETTRLDLLVRWRTATCRYRMESTELAVGTCRIGSTSVASRLAPRSPPLSAQTERRDLPRSGVRVASASRAAEPTN